MAAVRQERHTSSGDSSLDLEFTVDRVEMSVAERVYATLTVTARPEAVITLPTPGEATPHTGGAPVQTLGDFTVVSSERTEAAMGTLRTTTLRLVLEPFLAGSKIIPSLEVRAKDSGKGFSLRTEAVTVAVKPAAGDKDDAQMPLEPARAPMALAAPVTSRVSRGMVIAGAAATVAMLASFGFVIAHSRKRGRAVDPLIRVRAGFARSRETLAGDPTQTGALAAASLLHTTISTYLRDAMHIPADTHTGSSLAASIDRAERMTPDAKAELTRLLSDLERLRFAPDAASAPGVEQLVTRCATWVDSVNAAVPGGRA